MARLSVLNVDLNLLIAFDALVIEGSVTRAAARICVSQPAMSRSLRQLREIFGDTLFHRTADGMVPTPRAIELARLIRPGLATISSALGMNGRFDPATAKRRFVFAMPDLAAHLALPDIVRRVQCDAPNIDIAVINTGNRDGIAKVEAGEAEFAMGVFDHLPPAMMSANLRLLTEVCIADRDHPQLTDGKLDLQRFLSLPHAITAVNEDHGTPIDTVLETLGLKRRIALAVPHFLSIPRLIVGTSMIAVVADDLLRLTPERDRLQTFPVPVKLPDAMAKLIWHRRAEDDEGHQWLRQKMLAAVSP